MERILKFRGKRSDNGEWIVGSLLSIEDTCFIIEKVDFDFDYRTEAHAFWFDCTEKEVDPNTVGQFTGLLDKNGSPIYEGDRVNVLQAEGNFDIVVKWSNEAMAFMACYVDGKQSPFSWFTNLRIYQLTVVGSIHDNPSLISDKQ